MVPSSWISSLHCISKAKTEAKIETKSKMKTKTKTEMKSHEAVAHMVGEAVVPEEGHFLENKKIKIPPHFIFFRSFLKKVKTGEVKKKKFFFASHTFLCEMGVFLCF